MHAKEVTRGDRFEFGANWRRFLKILDDARISEAERSLKENLEVETLAGKSFLDIGSGSGLFSLAARQLGARVHSFDYDPQSVACTRELKRRYFPDDANWEIEEGNALDADYLKSLGRFDVVYSWGVLHHTGALWEALENAQIPVAPRGKLFIAVYNDQGSKSVLWKHVKKTYNGLPRRLKLPFALSVMVPREISFGLRQTLKLQPQRIVQNWTQYDKKRGMSRWHDIIDWVGGYPFEVAKPEEIFHYYRDKGFVLRKLKTVGGGSGNNQFVFERVAYPQQ